MTTTEKSLKDKAISIKGKDYVLVKDRIQYLSDNYEGRYNIETQYDYFQDRKLWVVKAELTIRNENHDSCCVYNGLAQEVESDNYKEVNFSSALENCESSAVGRACAMAGIGILESIASADEMKKAIKRSETAEKKAEPKEDNPNGWFLKATKSVNFMAQCLDEDDFIRKIKDKYTVDEIQERQLREAYKNEMHIDSEPADLPFA